MTKIFGHETEQTCLGLEKKRATLQLQSFWNGVRESLCEVQPINTPPWPGNSDE